MCGIAGRAGEGAGYLEPLKRMTESITHRGPDEDGYFVSPGIELGIRRLAIIDVVGSKQPITIENKSITVVFNGEIYNFQEIRKFLMQRGFVLHTDGDTEVLAFLYLLEGAEFVHRLRGMFAIAIWDARSRKLVLVRDRLGKKPLLYRKTSQGGIDFASEVRALLQNRESREPDMRALDFVLTFGYAPAPMTGFKDIESLPPGHMLIWQDGKVDVERYWQFDSSKKTINSLPEALHRTRETLEESVRLRLISERPLGVLLSGGIDSTLVAAMAAKHLPSKLKTYSLGFRDKQYDESNFARQVAGHLGTDHHELIMEPDPELLVRTLAQILDRPFADSSIMPTYLISKFAHSEVVVALGGDGGDEVYGGYSRYLLLDKLQRVNWLFRFVQPLTPGLAGVARLSRNRNASRMVGALRAYPSRAERYMSLVSLVHEKERENLWTPSGAIDEGGRAPADWFQRVWNEAKVSEEIGRPMAVDIETYLPEDLNFKVDIASMANSLELRSPFQDHKVVELGGQIADHLKFHNGKSKYILKQLASEFIPTDLIERKKMGFGIPRASWMRNELKDMVGEVLLGSSARHRGWFNVKEVEKQISIHNQGVDRDRILWPLFAIELWAQNWID